MFIVIKEFVSGKFALLQAICTDGAGCRMTIDNTSQTGGLHHTKHNNIKCLIKYLYPLKIKILTPILCCRNWIGWNMKTFFLWHPAVDNLPFKILCCKTSLWLDLFTEPFICIYHIQDLLTYLTMTSLNNWNWSA